jgi:hypothetical protein
VDHKDATMSRGTRVSMAVVSLSLVVCACGAVTPPTPTSVDSSVASLMLTTTEYAAALSGLSGAKPATRVSDAEVLGQAGTDVRNFFGTDGSLIAKIALYPYVSPAAAASGYPDLVSASCGTDRSIGTPPKIGTANQSAELECLADATFVVVFQQGAVEAAVASRVPKISEELAVAESAKLKRSSGA